MNGPVAVIGGINLDLRFVARSGGYKRASSTPVELRRRPGGVARNIAHNLAVLDVPVRLFGLVGDDSDGRDVLGVTRDVGVDTDGVEVRPDAVTGVYAALLTKNGELDTGAAAMDIMDFMTPEWIDGIGPDLQSSSIIVVDANLVEGSLQRVIEIANRASLPVVVDPVSEAKTRRLRGLAGTVFLATPNSGESTILKDARRLQIEHVVVTRGRRGARYRNPQGILVEVAAPQVDVVDVTGAGDAFCSGLVAEIWRGKSVDDSLEYAASVAARVVTRRESTVPAGRVSTPRDAKE